MSGRIALSFKLPKTIRSAVEAVQTVRQNSSRDAVAIRSAVSASQQAINEFDHKLVELQRLYGVVYGGTLVDAKESAQRPVSSSAQMRAVFESATVAMRRIHDELKAFSVEDSSPAAASSLLAALKSSMRPYTDLELAIGYLRKRSESFSLRRKRDRRSRIGFSASAVVFGGLLLALLVNCNGRAVNRDRAQYVTSALHMHAQASTSLVETRSVLAGIARRDSTLRSLSSVRPAVRISAVQRATLLRRASKDMAEARKAAGEFVLITLAEVQSLLLNAQTIFTQLPISEQSFGATPQFEQSVAALRKAQGLTSIIGAAERQMVNLILANDTTMRWHAAADAYHQALAKQRTALEAVKLEKTLTASAGGISFFDAALLGRNRWDVVVRLMYGLAYVLIAGGIILLLTELAGDSIKETFSGASKIPQVQNTLSLGWQVLTPVTVGAGLIGAAAITTPPGGAQRPAQPVSIEALTSRVDSVIRLLEPVPGKLSSLKYDTDSTFKLANVVQVEVVSRIQ